MCILKADPVAPALHFPNSAPMSELLPIMYMSLPTAVEQVVPRHQDYVVASEPKT